MLNQKKDYDFTHNTLKVLYKKINNIVQNLNNQGVSIILNTLDKKKCKNIIDNLNNKKFINRSTNIIKNIDLNDSNNRNIWWLHDYKRPKAISFYHH